MCEEEEEEKEKAERRRRRVLMGSRSGVEGAHSGLPEFQEAVFAVGADQVLVGVVGNADHILLMHLEAEGYQVKTTTNRT